MPTSAVHCCSLTQLPLHFGHHSSAYLSATPLHSLTTPLHPAVLIRRLPEYLTTPQTASTLSAGLTRISQRYISRVSMRHTRASSALPVNSSKSTKAVGTLIVWYWRISMLINIKYLYMWCGIVIEFLQFPRYSTRMLIWIWDFLLEVNSLQLTEWIWKRQISLQ